MNYPYYLPSHGLGITLEDIFTLEELYAIKYLNYKQYINKLIARHRNILN